MMRLSFPIFVIPPPLIVPLFIVACSLITLFLPISNFVCSPLYFKSCGSVPIEAKLKIFVLLPITVCPVILTCDCTSVPLLI